MLDEMWVDKYKPKTIDDMVLSPELKAHFKEMVARGQLANILLCGKPGIGKTTLANVLCEEMNVSKLLVSCASNGSIDMVRTLVKDFAESLDIDGRLKVILLDEMDSMSGSDTAQLASSAQKALRSIINDNQSDTRFILTANYENKIIGPIKSRCPLVRLSYNAKDLILRLTHILKAEDIEYTTDDLKAFANTVIKANYPDIRKIIHILQSSCSSGSLKLTGGETAETEYEGFVSKIYNMIISGDHKPLAIRKTVIRATQIFEDDWNRLGCSLFNLAAEDPQMTTRTLTLMIHGLHRLNTAIDAEIQFFGLILTLMRNIPEVA